MTHNIKCYLLSIVAVVVDVDVDNAVDVFGKNDTQQKM